jgi:hydrogenase maturation protease
MTTMVAGIGNIFLGDDAFGVELARRLIAEKLPEGVWVTDYGIRGMHLAYDLMDHDPARRRLPRRGARNPLCARDRAR